MPYFQTNKYVDEVNTYDTLHDNVCMSNLTGRCYHSPCECMWIYVNGGYPKAALLNVLDVSFVCLDFFSTPLRLEWDCNP